MRRKTVPALLAVALGLAVAGCGATVPGTAQAGTVQPGFSGSSGAASAGPGTLGSPAPRPEWRPMTPPTGSDVARCLQDTLSSTYYCVLGYGRYAVEIYQDSEKTMTEAVAAQGALLAGL